MPGRPRGLRRSSGWVGWRFCGFPPIALAARRRGLLPATPLAARTRRVMARRPSVTVAPAWSRALLMTGWLAWTATRSSRASTASRSPRSSVPSPACAPWAVPRLDPWMASAAIGLPTLLEPPARARTPAPPLLASPSTRAPLAARLMEPEPRRPRVARRSAQSRGTRTLKSHKRPRAHDLAAA